MMDKDEIIKYMLLKEQTAYEKSKIDSNNIKTIIITLLICLTIISLSFMYLVVPVEEETGVADNGSQVVVHSTVAGDNTNGL